jgi:hypothetical protein
VPYAGETFLLFFSYSSFFFSPHYFLPSFPCLILFIYSLYSLSL